MEKIDQKKGYAAQEQILWRGYGLSIPEIFQN